MSQIEFEGVKRRLFEALKASGAAGVTCAELSAVAGSCEKNVRRHLGVMMAAGLHVARRVGSDHRAVFLLGDGAPAVAPLRPKWKGKATTWTLILERVAAAGAVGIRGEDLREGIAGTTAFYALAQLAAAGQVHRRQWPGGTGEWRYFARVEDMAREYQAARQERDRINAENMRRWGREAYERKMAASGAKPQRPPRPKKAPKPTQHIVILRKGNATPKPADPAEVIVPANVKITRCPGFTGQSPFEPKPADVAPLFSTLQPGRYLERDSWAARAYGGR